MNRILNIILLLTAFLAVSCSYVMVEDTGLEELGITTVRYELPEYEGVFDVKLLANGPATITKVMDADWLTLAKDHFDSDCNIRMTYEANNGFPRYTKLLVSLDANPTTARDTILICQRGLKTPHLKLMESAVLVQNGEAGDNVTEVTIDTNIPGNDIEVTTRIFEDEGWIKEVNLDTDNGKLLLVTSDNAGESRRTAAVSLSYDKSWGEMATVNLRITQTNKDDSVGAITTFEALRQMATAEGIGLTDNDFVEAYVVSDVNSGNVNENPRLSVSTIDYEVCRKSAYIQSLDSRYGFLALTMTEEDNVFVNDSKVLLSLDGAILKKYSDPERYVLEGLTASSVIKAESAEIPEKEKYMSELTPEDIYTRVTLKDVEWPVRKGSLSPSFERMTNAADVNSATKFATLLRDIQGNSMYVYTNTTCPYRRDGSRMPYGSGKMRGVIVHEKQRTFIDEDAVVEDECGNIGLYQIRHNSKDDFMMKDDFVDSFSDMICEFRYMDKDAAGNMKATYGNGLMRHTKSYESYYDFSYLGPVGIDEAFYFGEHFGNENGFGIILENGDNYGMDLTGVNDSKTNAGRTPKASGLAWASSYWWDSDTSAPHYWEVEFSTSDISTDVLSMQISMLNQLNTADHRAARYWKVMWTPAGTGEAPDWREFEGNRFVVPDITPTSGVLIMSMSSAFKPVDIRLPLEMLGYEKVLMRIGPAENNAGRTKTAGEGGPVYQGLTMSSSAYGAGSMNYFAIRYNK